MSSCAFAEVRALRNDQLCRERFLKGNFEVEILPVNVLSLSSNGGIKT